MRDDDAESGCAIKRQRQAPHLIHRRKRSPASLDPEHHDLIQRTAREVKMTMSAVLDAILRDWFQVNTVSIKEYNEQMRKRRKRKSA